MSSRELQWPRPALAWTVVTLLCVTYCLSFVDRYLLTLLVQPIKADLDLSDTQIGLVSGVAFGIIYALAGFPMGALADRGSRRGLIAAGVFLWSAMTALTGFATSFAMLFAGRMGLGVGEAALTPAGLSLIADYFPPAKRGRAISIFIMGASIGSGLAIIVGGAVVELTRDVDGMTLPWIGAVSGWQLAFLAVGLPGMAFAALYMLVPEPARQVSAPVAGAGEPPLGRFLRERGALLGLQTLGMSICSACTYGFTAWAPTLLIRVFGWTPGEVGYGYGPIVLVSSVGGILTGGIVADRMVRKGNAAAPLIVAAWGLAGLAIATPLSTQMPTVGLTLAMFGIVTFVTAVPYGVSLTALVSVTPNGLRGKVSAIYMFCISVAGFGIGPTFVGYLSDHVFTATDGLRGAIMTLGLVTAPFAFIAVALAIGRYRSAIAEVSA